MVNQLLNGLTMLNNILEKILIAVGLLCLVTFVSITGAEVFSRYLLSHSIHWSNEIARLTFLWSVYLSAAVGFRYREHLVLDLIQFPPGSWLAKGHEAVILSLSFLFVMLFAVIGVITIQADIARFYAITRISYNWGYASLAVMGFAGVLFMLEVILNKIMGREQKTLSESK